MDEKLRLDLERALQREQRSLHDEVVGWARDYAMIHGWKDIKADLPDYLRADDHGTPAKIVWKATDTGHVPDVTGTKDGVLHIVEVKRRGAFQYQSTVDQLRLFSTYAAEHGAKFILFVDGDTEEEAQKFLDSHRIQGQVIAAWNRYRYEIEDAIAADGYRDYDD